MTATNNQLAASNTIRTSECAGFAASHSGLRNSAVPELRRLAQYEQLCGGAVAERASFFVTTPATVQQAQASAATLATTLRAFAASGVAPVVFMEPTDVNSVNLDLSTYARGAYDNPLETYFTALQTAGITSQNMGMWVFLPEGNLPVWSTVDPAIYSQVVVKTASIMKQHFPDSTVALMLDSKSYPVGGDWGAGKYVSLLPYVQHIPKGLIDSFGLQGFPWAGPANQAPSTSYDPTAYLRSDLAVEAARSLGVSSIWFNTGTFGSMYTNQAGATVNVQPQVRQAMLDGVLRVAQQVKGQNFTVAVHIFAQNKANLSEGTDWSYWRKQPGDTTATTVFSTFAHDAAQDGINLWLYDTTVDN